MALTADFAALDRIAVRLDQLAHPTDADVEPLLERWERILVEDNRKGVLEGTDKDDLPAPPLKYRGGGGRVTAPHGDDMFGILDRLAWKRANHPIAKRKVIRRNNNLDTNEYQKLTGPRLAPRGKASRVITHYQTRHDRDGSVWVAIGSWERVLSTRGFPFLIAHFDSQRSWLPRYDLRGVRKWGRDQARQAALEWGQWLLSRGGNP